MDMIEIVQAKAPAIPEFSPEVILLFLGGRIFDMLFLVDFIYNSVADHENPSYNSNKSFDLRRQTGPMQSKWAVSDGFSATIFAPTSVEAQ